MILRNIHILIFVALLFSSCAKKEVKEAEPLNQGTYFSIKDFARDQWNTYKGHPAGIMKIVNVNGDVDTVYTNLLEMDLGYVLTVFLETDIGKKKFLDKYKFSKFADATTSTINFYYEAKEPELKTRKLHIMADNLTMVIRSIYIETEKKTNLNTVTRKLFYQPLKVISIQEFETSKVGATKKMHIEYHFI